MEFHTVGIQDVGCALWFLFCRFFRRCPLLAEPAVSRGVIDGNTGLDVIGVDTEADALALVLHGPAFHQNAVGHQIGVGEHRRHPVQNMVVRLLYIVSHHVFKGQHSLDIQISGTGDEILLVGVLSCQLIPQQMAAVIEIFTVHNIIFHRLPP